MQLLLGNLSQSRRHRQHCRRPWRRPPCKGRQRGLLACSRPPCSGRLRCPGHRAVSHGCRAGCCSASAARRCRLQSRAGHSHMRLHQPVTVEEASHPTGGLTRPMATDEVPRPPQNVSLAAGDHPPCTLCRRRATAEEVELCCHQQRRGLQPAQLRVAEGLWRRRQARAVPAPADQGGCLAGAACWFFLLNGVGLGIGALGKLAGIAARRAN